MEEIGRILSLFILPGMALTLGMCFFFLSIPQKSEMKNYRIARYVMACAYIGYALSLLFSHYRPSGLMNLPFAQSISLSICAFQAFLFTFTLITLIDVHFLTRIRLFFETMLILSSAVTVIFLSSILPHQQAQIVVYIFCGLYVMLLIRYITLFRIHYLRYISKMENFFSNNEEERLQWVRFSFWVATFIGMLALGFTIFHRLEVAIPFYIVVLLFYMVFGIRFINYAFTFHTFEKVFKKDKYEIQIHSDKESADDELMKNIDELVKNKKLYLKNDVTIYDLALVLHKKHYTISETINRCRNINFKTYINEFRVEEAIRIILEDKEGALTIDAVASTAGFSDRSNFYRVFKKFKGVSPSDFRKNS